MYNCDDDQDDENFEIPNIGYSAYIDTTGLSIIIMLWIFKLDMVNYFYGLLDTFRYLVNHKNNWPH